MRSLLWALLASAVFSDATVFIADDATLRTAVGEWLADPGAAEGKYGDIAGWNVSVKPPLCMDCCFVVLISLLDLDDGRSRASRT
jgi:hypothetical protein